MGKKKRVWFLLLILTVAFSALYISTLRTEYGNMYILNKKETSFGSYVLTVAKDGAGAVFDLSCTREQYEATEVCGMVPCRWTLNLITHKGWIHEIYAVCEGTR